MIEICGDGIVQPGEECDDGNHDDSDGCNYSCTIDCRAIGYPCDVVSQCCSSADKVCEGPTRRSKTCQVCKAVGKPCTRYTQCCRSANKVCEGPAGKPKSCQVCKKRNAACARSTQCCAGLKCKNRKCLR
jgi:cysteine-rich repeat protein